jgi:hypothetical protein
MEAKAKGQLVIKVRTGREVLLEFPTDLSPMEVIDVIGYLATQLERDLVGVRGKQIVIPKPTVLTSDVDFTKKEN